MRKPFIQYDNSLIAEQDKRGRLIAAYKKGFEEGLDVIATT